MAGQAKGQLNPRPAEPMTSLGQPLAMNSQHTACPAQYQPNSYPPHTMPKKDMRSIAQHQAQKTHN